MQYMINVHLSLSDKNFNTVVLILREIYMYGSCNAVKKRSFACRRIPDQCWLKYLSCPNAREMWAAFPGESEQP